MFQLNGNAIKICTIFVNDYTCPRTLPSSSMVNSLHLIWYIVLIGYIVEPVEVAILITVCRWFTQTCIHTHTHTHWMEIVAQRSRSMEWTLRQIQNCTTFQQFFWIAKSHCLSSLRLAQVFYTEYTSGVLVPSLDQHYIEVFLCWLEIRGWRQRCPWSAWCFRWCPSLSVISIPFMHTHTSLVCQINTLDTQYVIHLWYA